MKRSKTLTEGDGTNLQLSKEKDISQALTSIYRVIGVREKSESLVLLFQPCQGRLEVK